MHCEYESPLVSRYAGKEMTELFSPNTKFKTWRALWVALAEAQQFLGLPISNLQIEEMKAAQNNINHDVAKKQEEKVRHDVMAHVFAYGEQCPNAKGIIHLGATSCYVGDNGELIVMRDALGLLRKKCLAAIAKLAEFAEEHHNLPTLGYTHFQPAQLTTVGKRACLWLQDLLLDLEEMDFVVNSLPFLGSKGTTGTQASFMALFDNDEQKVKALEEYIAKKFNFNKVVAVSGQTYSRKFDNRIMNVLSSIAQSSSKFSNDMRLLQHLKEVEEPYEKNQIGSSAMAYKRNPMRAERMAALCRYVVANAENTALTAAAQWLERTLDDSANKRIALPEAFLAVDAILNLYLDMLDGIVVYPQMIARHIEEELPFMATENILMDAVKCGGDRQVLHERIRQHSVAAAHTVKVEGKQNDLLERIAADDSFALNLEQLREILKPELYTGRASSQVKEFLEEHVKPVLHQTQEEWLAYLNIKIFV